MRLKHTIFGAQAVCAFLLLFNVGAGFLHAQQATPEEVRERFWGAADWQTEKTQVPEEWADEDAVIIYQENYNAYENRGIPGVFSIEAYRMRIKVLSSRVAEDNRTFKYVDNRDEKGRYLSADRFYVGFKILKASGEEIIADLSKSYSIAEGTGYEIREIELPELEVGDILDYYYYTEDRVISELWCVFRPDIQVLTSPHPIMKQKITYKVDKRFYINYKSINGAPDLKKEEDEDFVTYTFEEYDRDKFEPQLWHLPHLSSPTIKFQAIYVKGLFKGQLDQFLGEPGVAKNKVSQDEIAGIPRNRLKRQNPSATAGLKLLKKMKKSGDLPADAPKSAWVEYAFYELRDFLYEDRGFNSFTNTYVTRGEENKVFVKTMNEFLLAEEISHVIVAAIPRQSSTLDNLIIADEISFMIGLPGAEFTFLNIESPHTQFGELPAKLEGSDAWLLPPDIEAENSGYSRMELPISSHDANSEVIKAQLYIPDISSPKVVLKRNHKATGSAKVVWQELLFDKTLSEQVSTAQMELEEKYEVSVSGVKDFKVKGLGRELGEESLSFREEFEVNDLAIKAGEDFILKAGKLIGPQPDPAELELLREADIYFPYSGAVEYEFSIDIPPGYKALGIDNLTKVALNETGGFRSLARIEGTNLIISVSKFNINLSEPVYKWRKVLEWIQAAWDFSQQSIVLKKM